MYSCWHRKPELRPSFSTLKGSIDCILKYGDIDHLNELNESYEDSSSVSLGEYDHFHNLLSTTLCKEPCMSGMLQFSAPSTESINNGFVPSTTIGSNLSFNDEFISSHAQISPSNYLNYKDAIKYDNKPNQNSR